MRHGICMLVALMVLGAGLSILLAAPAQAQTASDVVERDRLIAAQEALLNVYRCRFDIDTEIVPGGCGGGTPVIPAVPPVPFTGTPNRADIAERDRLVAAQEALLNVYRCRFDIDTEIVPGGCISTPEPDPPTTQTPPLEVRTTAAIPVFYCAPAGRYSESELADVVADLNQYVTPFYARESSGLANVYFTAGGIVSPSFDWQNTTLSDLFDRGSLSACDVAAIAEGQGSQILILIDIESGERFGGYATNGLGPSRVSLRAWGGPFGGGFHYIVAHEIGHGLFGLEHTDDEEIRAYQCSEVVWSLMNGTDECRIRSTIDPLSFDEILCWQKEELDWPCFDPAPAVPLDYPRSYGRWSSYASSEFAQVGVVTAALPTEGVSPEATPTLRMSCEYYESRDEWELFSYVGWEDGGVSGDADGDLRVEVLFSNGEILRLTGYEGAESRFMNLTRPSSLRLFDAVLRHEGMSVTLSTTSGDGKTYSATFATDGAAIAVRSVMNFCATKAMPPAEDGGPVSSGVWRSYESTEFVQVGVLTSALQTEGISDNNVPSLRMACEFYESSNRWGLFSYVGWDGDSVFGASNGDLWVEARFSNGDVLTLAGREGSGARFTTFDAFESFRLFDAVLGHDGMSVVVSTTDRDGNVYSAAFDTEGANVAVRSVMSFCEAAVSDGK